MAKRRQLAMLPPICWGIQVLEKQTCVPIDQPLFTSLRATDINTESNIWLLCLFWIDSFQLRDQEGSLQEKIFWGRSGVRMTRNILCGYSRSLSGIAAVCMREREAGMLLGKKSTSQREFIKVCLGKRRENSWATHEKTKQKVKV